MKKIIWFDFENAPHVWVFSEIINSLSKYYEILVTLRNFSSTISICKYLHIVGTAIGGNGKGKTNLGKLASVIRRAIHLKEFINKNKIKPALAISHCSRSQALACLFLDIPVIFLDDYEYTFNGFHYLVKDLLTPSVIPAKVWGKNAKKVIHYPGLKEELYLWNEKNWKTENISLIKNDKINFIFRPEGYNTHYSSKQSQVLQTGIIEQFKRNENIHIILIARDKFQEELLADIFNKKNIDYSIPSGIVNGPALISQCDAVIGGGGTMTREACVLNIPAYSFFGGKIGAVDKYLESKKLLKHIKKLDDIENIEFVKKDKFVSYKISIDAFVFIRDFIVDKIENLKY